MKITGTITTDVLDAVFLDLNSDKYNVIVYKNIDLDEYHNIIQLKEEEITLVKSFFSVLNL